MPDETVQQKAERQTRLSHAMGVMFLQDKVDKLERDVSKITYPRGMRQTRSGPAAELATQTIRHEASQGRPKPRALTGPGMTSTATDGPTDRNFKTRNTAASVRLIDTSVLIFSLRSVHNWSRDQSTCVIIPLEAINTLDLLKKGDEPINLAARKATRWLEDKIAISNQEGDAMLTQPAPGIFAQRECFRAATSQIEKARAAALSMGQSEAVELDTDGAKNASRTAPPTDIFDATEAPRYLRELLSICVYCNNVTSADADFAVAIAYPPAHLQDRMMDAQSSSNHSNNDKPSYLERTDGRATEAWLDAYGIPFDLVPTSKTWTGEKASSRFRHEVSGGGSHGVGSSDDLLGSTKQEAGAQQRRNGSPTPSVSSSTSSFKSEFSAPSMFGSSHRSPHHRQDARFSSNSAATCGSSLRSIRCMSTSTSANALQEASTITGTHEDAETETDDMDGPIIARPSSAASSHTSFVSSLTTTSTQDDWSSSQTSTSCFSSHCGGIARINRHCASMPSSAAAEPSTITASDGSTSAPAQRLTNKRMLHKTKSGADKMEEYLRRLQTSGSTESVNSSNNALVEGGGRTATATPTPTFVAGGGSGGR